MEHHCYCAKTYGLCALDHCEHWPEEKEDCTCYVATIDALTKALERAIDDLDTIYENLRHRMVKSAESLIPDMQASAKAALEEFAHTRS